MAADDTKEKGLFGQYKDLGRTVLSDLKTSDFRDHVKKDVRGLYDFYVDEDTRARLARMSRFRRWLWQAGWMLRNLLMKLSPARRALLVLAIVLFFLGSRDDPRGENHDGMLLLSMLTLLSVLALELRDKLVARDELEVGREIQLSLLPTDQPDLAGWDIWLYTRAANDVGGDLVDYIPFSASEVGIALGDVSGKGLGAALLMAKLQATLRALVREKISLADFGDHVNRIMCRDGITGRFATLVYVEVHADSGTVRLLNAGHPPPVVLRKDHIEELSPMALPVGVKATEEYVEQIVEMGPDDILLLYSDGVTEARNAGGQLFGEKRLRNVVSDAHGQSAQDLASDILRAVASFVIEDRYDDDLSLAILRRRSG